MSAEEEFILSPDVAATAAAYGAAEQRTGVPAELLALAVSRGDAAFGPEAVSEVAASITEQSRTLGIDPAFVTLSAMAGQAGRRSA